MTQTIGGFLQVGTDGCGAVVINHPDVRPDETGTGHIVFSPAQARHLATLLWTSAAEADLELEPPQIAPHNSRFAERTK